MALHIPARKYKQPLLRECPNIIHCLRRAFSLQMPYFAMTSTCLRRIKLEKLWLEEHLIYTISCSKWEGLLLLDRWRKQVSIKAKPRKTTCFWSTVSWRQGHRDVYSAAVCDGQFEKVRMGQLIKWLNKKTKKKINHYLFLRGFCLAPVCQDLYFQQGLHGNSIRLRWD